MTWVEMPLKGEWEWELTSRRTGNGTDVSTKASLCMRRGIGMGIDITEVLDGTDVSTKASLSVVVMMA